MENLNEREIGKYYLHVTSSPSKPLRQQCQGVNRPLWLGRGPAHLRKCLSYSRTIKPHYVMTRPYSPYTQNHNQFHIKITTLKNLNKKGKNFKKTVENVEDGIGDLSEGRGGDDSVGSDAVAADGERGNERGVGGSDEGGVAMELLEFLRTYEDGSEFENGEALAGSGRDGGFDVEEGDFGSVSV